MAENVLTRRDRRIGRIQLNRSEALNALDLGMIRGIRAALEDWRSEPAIHAVVIESAD
ncbi:MAG: enoyl-CoA hydratase/isomerase family protein, partial [Acetobacteraceae bacterium]